MFHDIFSKRVKIKNKKIRSLIIDIHEKNSLLPSELKKRGINIILKHLKSGDYIVNNVIIERKEINDFVNSLVSNRLDNQIKKLLSHDKKIILIEGNFSNLKSKINKNILYGKILSILLKNKIPIIFTKDYLESADYIEILLNKKNKDYLK